MPGNGLAVKEERDTGKRKRRWRVPEICSESVSATSYMMAKQMGGDEALVSGSIVLSTLLSAISLATVLWIS